MLKVMRFWLLASFVIAFSCLAHSCAETIVMDPEEEMPIVVNCVLTNDGMENSGIVTQYLDLYYAKRPSEAVLTPISDAKVIVKGRGQIAKIPSSFVGNLETFFSETHTFEWNGERWQCDFIPDYNKMYTLEITVGDLKLKARTFFPSSIRLFPVYPALKDDEGNVVHVDDAYFPQVAYYFGQYFEHRKLISSYKEGNNTYTTYDLLSGYAPYNGELYAWIKSDNRLSTDHRDADGLNMIAGTWSDLERNTDYADLSEAKYFPEEYKSYSSQLPLYQGFIHIHQKPGFKGTAPASAFSETHYYDGETSQIVSPDYFFLLASDNPKGSGYGLGRFKIYYVSPEYDAYLRNLADVGIVHGEEFSSIYSATPVYTNIEGGLGIFGAMTTGTRYPGVYSFN